VDVLPTVRLESLLDVLGEGDVGVTVDGDVVVVVDGDQVSELEVTGQRGGLGGDTLLKATVTGEHYERTRRYRQLHTVSMIDKGEETDCRCSC
jgi:hypothetical protein